MRVGPGACRRDKVRFGITSSSITYSGGENTDSQLKCLCYPSQERNQQRLAKTSPPSFSIPCEREKGINVSPGFAAVLPPQPPPPAQSLLACEP